MTFGFGLSYTALGYVILRQNRRQSPQEFLDAIERRCCYKRKTKAQAA